MFTFYVLVVSYKIKHFDNKCFVKNIPLSVHSFNYNLFHKQTFFEKNIIFRPPVCLSVGRSWKEFILTVT